MMSLDLQIVQVMTFHVIESWTLKKHYRKSIYIYFYLWTIFVATQHSCDLGLACKQHVLGKILSAFIQLPYPQIPTIQKFLACSPKALPTGHTYNPRASLEPTCRDCLVLIPKSFLMGHSSCVHPIHQPNSISSSSS